MAAPCEVFKANVDIRSDLQNLSDANEQYAEDLVATFSVELSSRWRGE